MCVWVFNFASFYSFLIGVWNFSDSMIIFFPFYFIYVSLIPVINIYIVNAILKKEYVHFLAVDMK